MIDELRNDGFEPYLTSVGGSGVGVLSPHGGPNGQEPSAYEAPATPPETPNANESSGLQSSSLRSVFENATASSFASWAEGKGRWLYV